MKPKLKDLNENITCSICFGYLIDATTVIECLCTFCKTCIVKHLDEHNTCPKCNEVIHQSHPKEHIRFDRTLQSIVYKVVPGLQKKVEQLRAEYEASNPEVPSSPTSDAEECNGDTNGNPPRRARSPLPPLHNTSDYIVPVQVDPHKATINGNSSDSEMDDKNGVLKELSKPILGCPARCPIRVIKKFVQTKLNVQDELDLDILCNDEILGKDHTLEFIKMTRWRTKDLPLVLTYRVRPDI
ncbi:hypothetical protein ACHWQZ_G003320 [Mnemiopsis leidyi]